jgi:hypothetical protein
MIRQETTPDRGLAYFDVFQAIKEQNILPNSSC